MGIDLEQPSREHHKEDSGPHVDVNRDVATVSSNAEHDKQNGRPNVSGCTSNSGEKGHATNAAAVNFLASMEPHEGMEFESKEDAFSFYKEYAKSIGFATITKSSRRSRITGKFIDAKFVCTRYGSKREPTTSETPEPVTTADSSSNAPIKKKRGRISQSWSKTDCKACMHVKRTQDGRWVIRSFTKEHNHEIFPDQAYYYRGHRNIDLGSLSQESYNIAFNALETALKKCENVNDSIQSVLEPGLPPVDGLHDFDEGAQGNITSKTTKKSIVSKKGKELSDSEMVTMGMHDSWQQMEQLNSRVPALDGFFGTQQIMKGMGDLNSMASSHDNYYSNQRSMQGLGQLNSIAPLHDGHYITQQRLHGLGHLAFRPQSMPNCFDIQDMDQSDVGSTQIHGLASKHFHSKHLSQ
ncbi:hypothetical protein Vadar_026046 [Vaccinium darrowii]|uniref:Uncharacterized protein n=1 Tax=Vaccinium darrowii TaxID=229202 RepID=A0ACB7XCK2_9ERIC|nr:hypothetical protein Vadar_026046 [Vaccinium darrowii]